VQCEQAIMERVAGSRRWMRRVCAGMPVHYEQTVRELAAGPDQSDNIYDSISIWDIDMG
jgi:hypothetical protein